MVVSAVWGGVTVAAVLAVGGYFGGRSMVETWDGLAREVGAKEGMKRVKRVVGKDG